MIAVQNIKWFYGSNAILKEEYSTIYWTYAENQFRKFWPIPGHRPKIFNETM